MNGKISPEFPDRLCRKASVSVNTFTLKRGRWWQASHLGSWFSSPSKTSFEGTATLEELTALEFIKCGKGAKENPKKLQ